jgi:murein L,D-transpeptidase YafK
MGCYSTLGKIVGSYNTFAAEVFPQTAKSVRGSEIAFLMKRLEMRSELYE